MKQLMIMCLFFVAFSFISAQTEDSVKSSKATDAVENWLKIIDNGDYGKSWDEGAELFRKSITKEKWQQAVTAAREPFGKFLQREVKAKKYSTQIPGGPEGEYYSFEFFSSFANKKESVETIAVMLEGDEWKVIGYFIR